MAKYIKLAALGVIGLLLLIVQLSLVNALPFVWRQSDLVLVFLLLTLFLFGFKPAIWLAVGLGFFADTLDFGYFGLQLLSLPAVIILADIWLVNWFTNRSVYSFLALTLAATIFHNLIYYSLLYLSRFWDDSTFFFFTGNFWAGLGLQIISNSLLLFLFFALAGWNSLRFRPVFLER